VREPAASRADPDGRAGADGRSAWTLCGSERGAASPRRDASPPPSRASRRAPPRASQNGQASQCIGPDDGTGSDGATDVVDDPIWKGGATDRDPEPTKAVSIALGDSGS